jgi:hypothetical protein
MKIENLRKAVETLEDFGTKKHKKGHSENKREVTCAAAP